MSGIPEWLGQLTIRWVTGSQLIEPHLRGIKGNRHLPQLRAALLAKIGTVEQVGELALHNDGIEAAPEL